MHRTMDSRKMALNSTRKNVHISCDCGGACARRAEYAAPSVRPSRRMRGRERGGHKLACDAKERSTLGVAAARALKSRRCEPRDCGRLKILKRLRERDTLKVCSFAMRGNDKARLCSVDFPEPGWRYRRWLGDLKGSSGLSEFSGELSKPDLKAVEIWGCDAYRLSSRGFVDVFFLLPLESVNGRAKRAASWRR